MKTVKLRHPSDRMLIFVLLILIALVIGVLALVADRQSVIWKQVQGTNNDPASASVGSLPVKVYIQNAVRLLYRNSGVVNTQDDRVYIPELKINLPMNQLSRDLRYSYTAADPNNNVAEQASFQSEQALNMLIQSFSDVPCQQRLVGLAVNQQNGYQNGGKYAGSVALDDGRTLYLYSNETSQTKNCQSIWGPEETPAAAIDLLKQAKSY